MTGYLMDGKVYQCPRKTSYPAEPLNMLAKPYIKKINILTNMKLWVAVARRK